MWDKFTEGAKKVVLYAQQEAEKLDEQYVSTEHLLLGLIRDRGNVASSVVARMGIDLNQVDLDIRKVILRGKGRVGDCQLTPRAKRVVDIAYAEARGLNNSYIGTEHLLLGLIGEAEGLGGRTLLKYGATSDLTRQAVVEFLAGGVVNTEHGAVWPPSPITSTAPRTALGAIGISDTLKSANACLRYARLLYFAYLGVFLISLFTPAGAYLQPLIKPIAGVATVVIEVLGLIGLLFAIDERRRNPSGRAGVKTMWYAIRIMVVIGVSCFAALR